LAMLKKYKARFNYNLPYNAKNLTQNPYANQSS